MVKRKKVALVYAYNENWIGGTYYIENLISALGRLPDVQQPELIIFSTEASDAERLQQNVQYSHWSFRALERKLSLLERVINKTTAMVLRRRFISLYHADIDLVFPVPTAWRHFFSRIENHLYWIPDFQEYYLPVFFKTEEIQGRKTDQALIIQTARNIVFSSHAAQNDFNTIYPGNKLEQHVLQFAVTSRPASGSASECLARYGIDRPYFICSNQFWKHKNHTIVLKALAGLKRTHPQVLVVFTGKEHDYRNPTYFEELMALRLELDLSNQTKFLGFISREDQLALMQAAAAVIQPSLFEGWSTVVEDAKSMSVPLVVSALDVHKEQLADYAAKIFFAPEDAGQLRVGMAQVLDGQLCAQPYAYDRNLERFAREFVDIVSLIVDYPKL